MSEGETAGSLCVRSRLSLATLGWQNDNCFSVPFQNAQCELTFRLSSSVRCCCIWRGRSMPATYRTIAADKVLSFDWSVIRHCRPQARFSHSSGRSTLRNRNRPVLPAPNPHQP